MQHIAVIHLIWKLVTNPNLCQFSEDQTCTPHCKYLHSFSHSPDINSWQQQSVQKQQCSHPIQLVSASLPSPEGANYYVQDLPCNHHLHTSPWCLITQQSVTASSSKPFLAVLSLLNSWVLSTHSLDPSCCTNSHCLSSLTLSCVDLWNFKSELWFILEYLTLLSGFHFLPTITFT